MLRVRLAVWILFASVAFAPATAGANESADRPLQQAQIGAGGEHTCVVLADGAVRCWGADSFGELGDGGVAAPAENPSPRPQVPLGQPARAVASGLYHTCALLLDGAVRCWGDDTQGQLGDGTVAAPLTNASPGPAVALGQPARAVSTSETHTCALLADASVRCWGEDTFGQLGDGTVGPDSAVPAPAVVLGEGAQAVAAGENFTCALLAGGDVRCWGRDRFGERGDGTIGAPTSNPTAGPAVALGQPARAIAAAGEHACAILADASLRCWGRNLDGELGAGTLGTDSATPTGPVPVGQPVRSVSAGSGDNTCALLGDGTVKCWGWDTSGQNGDGTIAAPSGTITPGPAVALGQSARAVSLGETHSCALLADATIKCWGNDGEGQLGDGVGGVDSPTPTGPVGLPGLASPDSADLSVTLTAPVVATVGDTVTLTATVASAGIDPSTATVDVGLPGGLTVVSATPSQGTYSASTGFWRVGTLPASASATLVLTARVLVAGALTSTAEIVGAGAQDPDSTPGNDVAGEDDRAGATTTATATAAAPGPPVTAPTPTPAADTVNPKVTLVVPRQRLRTVLVKGLKLTVRSTELGRVAATLSDGKPSARAAATIGSGKATITQASTAVTVKLSATAVRRLRKAKRARVTVVVRVTDAAGNRGTARKTITL